MTTEIGHVDKPRTKAQMSRAISEQTGYSASVVNEVIDAMAQVVENDLSEGGIGTVTIAGLVKIDIQEQQQRDARTGRNPATGDPIQIPERPYLARVKVRVRALKRLRDVL